ncbi:MAG TPA: VWA domain-containing protein [Terriglobales bacterium]
MRSFLRLFLLILLTSVCLGDGILYLRVHRPVMEERLKLSPGTQQARLDTLRNLFKAAGCPAQQITEQHVRGQNLPNLICTLTGDGEGTIVVGASASYEDQGDQSKPNWGSLVMLPLLVESLNAVPHHSTLAFVAFTGRDHGSQGASWYVDQLGKLQRSTIRAMVDLEALGKSSPAYKLAQDDRALATWLEIAASMLRLPHLPSDLGRPSEDSFDDTRAPGPRVEVASVSLGEAKPFGRAHIPAIGIQSLPGDNAVLDMQAYEDTYKLLCVYLTTLDRNLGRTATTSAPQVAAVSVPTTGPSEAPASTPPVQGSSAPSTTEVATTTPPASVSSEPPPVPVFRVKTQLVLVDVTARDKQGNSVKGLQASDFTILENGKPQQIRVFEPHNADEKPAAELSSGQPTPALPPHTFTNRNLTTSNETLSVVLFDLLNTPTKDQNYARSQMLKFLKELPANRRISIFVLSSRLMTLSKFSGNSAELTKAVAKLMASQPVMLDTEEEREQFDGDATYVGTIAVPNVPADPSGRGDTSSASNAIRENQIDFGHARARKRSEATTRAERTKARIVMTLDAITGISRAVATYPGRKNLVWLSGSFPIQLRPVSPQVGELTQGGSSTAPVDPLNASFNYSAQIRDTTAMLAAARIAVYPVDVRGLQVGGLDIANSAGDTLMKDGDGGSGNAKILTDQSSDRYQNRTGMNDVAQQTGGEVFANSNDIKGAILHSIDDGSNYYTIAYSPDGHGPDQVFRNIEVRVDRDGVRLAYRRGYYPKPKEAVSPEISVHALAAAMIPDAPPATMLLVTAQVLPPDAEHKTARLDYKIDLAGVDFTDAPDGRKQGLLDCMAIAFDKDGNDVGHVANTIGITLNPAEYEAMLRNGVPMHQEMTLPVGTYQVRIGVMDRVSQKVGTVDAPLVVTEQSASK